MNSPFYMSLKLEKYDSRTSKFKEKTNFEIKILK
jgi:hypothetical protein